MHYFHYQSYFHVCFCVVRALYVFRLHGFFRRGFAVHHVSYWFVCDFFGFGYNINILKLTTTHKLFVCKNLFNSTQFQSHTETTRIQRAHENYAVIDESHCQNKMPKYAPIFVAVSFISIAFFSMYERWVFKSKRWSFSRSDISEEFSKNIDQCFVWDPSKLADMNAIAVD